MKFSNIMALLRPVKKTAIADTLVDQPTQMEDQARQLAYQQILKKTRFVTLDGMNEYDEDYRHFIPIGDLITEEMWHAMQRLQQQDEASSIKETLSAAQPVDDKQPPSAEDV